MYSPPHRELCGAYEITERAIAMAYYGYTVSGLVRIEKFSEVEQLLDKKLKDYEKSVSGFEKDGSMTVTYSKKNEDESVNQVRLVKNVTESNISVFSDIPLPYLRFGGKLLWLRDIVPTALFALLQWLGISYCLKTAISFGQTDYIRYAVICLFSAAVLVMLDIVTDKLLSKNRGFWRKRAIQNAAVVNIPMAMFYICYCLTEHQTLLQSFNRVSTTPLIAVALAAFVSVKLLSDKKKRK